MIKKYSLNSSKDNVDKGERIGDNKINNNKTNAKNNLCEKVRGKINNNESKINSSGSGK